MRLTELVFGIIKQCCRVHLLGTVIRIHLVQHLEASAELMTGRLLISAPSQIQMQLASFC